MSRTRKDAIAKIESLVPQVEAHLGKIDANPGHSSRHHWKREVRNWLMQMEALLPHVGKKTAAQWQARIDAWRATLERTSDAE